MATSSCGSSPVTQILHIYPKEASSKYVFAYIVSQGKKYHVKVDCNKDRIISAELAHATTTTFDWLPNFWNKKSTIPSNLKDIKFSNLPHRNCKNSNIYQVVKNQASTSPSVPSDSEEYVTMQSVSLLQPQSPSDSEAYVTMQSVSLLQPQFTQSASTSPSVPSNPNDKGSETYVEQTVL